MQPHEGVLRIAEDRPATKESLIDEISTSSSLFKLENSPIPEFGTAQSRSDAFLSPVPPPARRCRNNHPPPINPHFSLRHRRPRITPYAPAIRHHLPSAHERQRIGMSGGREGHEGTLYLGRKLTGCRGCLEDKGPVAEVRLPFSLSMPC